MLPIIVMEIISSHCRVPPLPSLFRLNADFLYGGPFRSNRLSVKYHPLRTAVNRVRPFIITFSYSELLCSLSDRRTLPLSSR